MPGFDPYHVWLGISPKDQPPNHYRLLGIEVFESDADVITFAADSRMSHLRTLQLSKQSKASQQILNEVAAARVCLLNAKKKADYDADLRASQQISESAAVVVIDGLPFLEDLPAQPVHSRHATRMARKRAARKRTVSVMIFFAAVAGVAALVSGLMFYHDQQVATVAVQQPKNSDNAERNTRNSGRAADAHTAENSKTPVPLATDAVSTLKPFPEKLPAEPATAQPSGSDGQGVGDVNQPDARPELDPLATASGKSPLRTGEGLRAVPRPKVTEEPGAPGDNKLADGDDLHPARMGKFIMALCQDLDGNLWVGTEDTGVWRYSPKAEQGRRWAQFTRERSGGKRETTTPALPASPADAVCLGDDFAYALACDKLGRVWVGHLNHGVSVFNGTAWRNFDLLTGPLGERVFAIATNPVDGDVWIATSAGLTRYHLKADTWTNYTCADGLPSDQIQCLAFDKSGTLFAGTQCDGLAIAVPIHVDGRLEYKVWRQVASPSVDDRPPVAPGGVGLPTNLLNDVLVARDGAVYLATTMGLAASRDRGRTWSFLRGQDWEAKAKGLLQPPPAEVLKAAGVAAKGRTLLREDFVTCLAEDETGNLWIGHRDKDCEVVDPHSGQRPLADQPANYVTRLLEYRDEFLAATYGQGICRLAAPAPAKAGTPAAAATRRTPPGAATVGNEPVAAPAVPALPLPAPPPLIDLNTQLAASLKTSPAISGMGTSRSKTAPLVVSLPDDWRTQGDWLGRYGRYWSCCCAICSPKE